MTNSMDQRPWEANRFSASQQIPCILWNLKVYYRINKGLPGVCILSQINSFHVPYPISWKSILISSHLHLGLQSGLFSLGFATKTL